MDRYTLSRLAILETDVTASYEAFQFFKVYQARATTPDGMLAPWGKCGASKDCKKSVGHCIIHVVAALGSNCYALQTTLGLKWRPFCFQCDCLSLSHYSLAWPAPHTVRRQHFYNCVPLEGCIDRMRSS